MDEEEWWLMSTSGNETAGQPDEKAKPKRKRRWILGASAIFLLLIIGGTVEGNKLDSEGMVTNETEGPETSVDVNATSKPTPSATKEQTTVNKSTTESTLITSAITSTQKNASTAPTRESTTPEPRPEIDREMAPQDWWDEWYRSRHCVSQDMRFGGLALCMARGVDTADDGKTLVFYVDQDEPGVQDRFTATGGISGSTRQSFFTQSLLGKVAAEKPGDSRLQYVDKIRVIATGGEGWFSGWQEDAKL